MDQDSRYFLRRAEAVLALAQAALHPSAVRAHYHLAGHYLDRAYSSGIEKPEPPRIMLDHQVGQRHDGGSAREVARYFARSEE